MQQEEWLTWDIQRVEDEYSPSRSSQRCRLEGITAKVVIEEHLSFASQESDEVRKTIPHQLDVPYGVGEREKFDIYGAESLPTDAPVFVYIHGGYWHLLDRFMSAYCVEPLYRAGIITIILGFEVAPKVEVSEIVQQNQTALSVILKWAAERGSSGVAIGGHCSGAHLTTMLLYRDSDWGAKEPNLKLIRGLVLISGIFDIRPVVITYLNKDIKLTSETAEKNSPILNLDTLKRNVEYLKHVKHVVVAAENDPSEFKRQSQEYATALRDAGFEVNFKVLDSLDHFQIVEKLREKDHFVTQQIMQLLK